MTRDIREAVNTEGVVETVARIILNRRGFGFYTDPMEGGQDAYDLSLDALDEAREILAAMSATHLRGLVTALASVMPSEAAIPHASLQWKWARAEWLNALHLLSLDEAGVREEASRQLALAQRMIGAGDRA